MMSFKHTNAVNQFINSCIKVVKKSCTENFKKDQSIELQTKFLREINVEWDKFYMGPPISFNTSSYGIVVKNNAGSIISIELDSYIVEYKKARLQLIETVQKNNDVAKTFFYYNNLLQAPCWDTTMELTKLMVSWRKYAYSDELTILDENNKTFEIDGKFFHTLVVQSVNDDKYSVDKLGIGMDFRVNGSVYWFATKETRDLVIKYVMNDKIIEDIDVKHKNV